MAKGAGANIFAGFLSPDEKYRYCVKEDRALRKVCLQTLTERESGRRDLKNAVSAKVM